MAVLVAVIVTVVCINNSSENRQYEELILQGDKYLHEENYVEAANCYQDAMESIPQRKESWLGLAEIYFKQGAADVAIDVLWEALDYVDNDDKAEIELQIQSYEESLRYSSVLTYPQVRGCCCCC